MTAAQILTLIKNKAGEGFEHWDAEAINCFKEAVISLTKVYTSNHYPVMIITDHEYEVTDTDETAGMIEFSSIMPGDEQNILSLIRMLKMVYAMNSEDPVVSYDCVEMANNEYAAYLLKASLLATGQKAYTITNLSTNLGKTYINIAAVETDTLTMDMLIWNDYWFSDTTTIQTHFWSEEFLNVAINLASELLMRQIST